MQADNLIGKATSFVSAFLAKNLAPWLSFHNSNHTFEVLEAARIIGAQENLSASDLKIVELAALFHDCGYAELYKGHEEISKKIAADFLVSENCSFELIKEVCEQIDATRFPQTPTSLKANILCDADMFHLSKPYYHCYAHALHEEQQIYFGAVFTEKEWAQRNIGVMEDHHYFTDYGKQILSEFKMVNRKF